MKKAVAATIIFLVLFAGAWILNEKTKHDFYVPMDEDEVVEVVPAEMNDSNKPYRPLKMFESREYVRIIAS